MLDTRGFILPDHDPTPPTLGYGPEAKRRLAARPIALPGDGKNPFRRALSNPISLEFGKTRQKSSLEAAGWGRTVDGLGERNELDLEIVKFTKQRGQVANGSAETVKFGNDYDVDLPSSYLRYETVECWPEPSDPDTPSSTYSSAITQPWLDT